MTISEMIAKLQIPLDAHSIQNPRLQSELIVMKTLSIGRASLYTRSNESLTPENFDSMEKDLSRLLAGEPWAYICGFKEFYGVNFIVEEGIFIPRPETELIVDIVLSLKSRYRQSRIVEPCVGSGAISIALTKNMPDAQFEVTDISTKCLMITRQNASLNGITNITVYKEGNLLNGIKGNIDIIVSNPPYIETSLLDALSEEIQFEPTLARDGGYRGLEVITDMLAQAQQKISHPGHIIFEISPIQTHEVFDLSQTFFPDALINVHKDLALLDRVVSIELE